MQPFLFPLSSYNGQPDHTVTPAHCPKVSYSEASKRCVKLGTLEKMSVHNGSLTGQKTRHFVLRDGYLFYYKKQQVSHIALSW